MKTIFFGGDQLTEERASNCQKGFLDGDTQLQRMKGLKPKNEDCHLKRTIYDVLINNFIFQIVNIIKNANKTVKILLYITFYIPSDQRLGVSVD